MPSRPRNADLRTAILRLSEMPDSRREAVLDRLDQDARGRALVLLAQLTGDGAPIIPDWLAARASPAGPEGARITDAARDELRRRIADIGAMPAPEAMRPSRTLAGRVLSLLA